MTTVEVTVCSLPPEMFGLSYIYMIGLSSIPADTRSPVRHASAALLEILLEPTGCHSGNRLFELKDVIC